jgi:hypothetical protein
MMATAVRVSGARRPFAHGRRIQFEAPETEAEWIELELPSGYPEMLTRTSGPLPVGTEVRVRALAGDGWYPAGAVGILPAIARGKHRVVSELEGVPEVVEVYTSLDGSLLRLWVVVEQTSIAVDHKVLEALCRVWDQHGFIEHDLWVSTARPGTADESFQRDFARA